uniref:PIF1/LRR1 pleckstrin homology domain-containing protein n=2 Tax=Clastoptera arizonana TaxID=38151 RepID=A0A1B6E5G5_9HEMI
MKIDAMVKVGYRDLLEPGKITDRHVKSILTIGKEAGGKNEVFIIVKTNQLETGRKYKVNNNIEQVFLRFLKEGKSTIRFKEPRHDLSINSDPIQLKAFLKVLKLVNDGTGSYEKHLSSLYADSKIMSVKKKLAIVGKQDFSVDSKFPRTIEELKICEVNMKYFDKRILHLPNLKTLCLSKNQLLEIPDAFGSLPNISTLDLSDNLLGSSRAWNWLTSTRIVNTLSVLNLANNKLGYFPLELLNLNNLYSLNLSRNQITALPGTVGFYLKSIREMDLSFNLLKYVPVSVKILNLEKLNVSSNPFLTDFDSNELIPQNFGIMSLFDLAAGAVENYRIPFSLENIPKTIFNYVKYQAGVCICRKITFRKNTTHYSNRNIIASQVWISRALMCMVVNFCSFSCYTTRRSLNGLL